MSAYGLVLRRTGLPAYFWLRGYRILRYLRDYRASQWLSARETQHVQWQRLLNILRHAYEEIPFYRARLESVDLHPDAIESPAEFTRMPVLTRSDLQEHLQDLITPGWPASDLIADGTGGSTGEPVRFHFSKDSSDRRAAAAARSDQWAGWDYGERTAWLWGTGLDNLSESRVQRLRSKAYWAIRRERVFNAFAPSDDTVRQVAHALLRFRPSVIVAFATRACEVGRFLLESGLSGSIRPRGVITSGEALSDYQRSVIEDAFGCSVFNRYGCREFSLIAAECERHEGLHINCDNVYVEFVHNGEPGSRDGNAKLVVTDLTNYAMPLIRYEIGDLGKRLERACSCGRGAPLMSVEGRTCDTVVGANGRALSGIFFGHLLKHAPGVRRFQVYQPNASEVELRVVPRHGFADLDLEWAIGRISEALGPGTTVMTRLVDDIPLTRSGKHRLVISCVEP